jgi:hypothetical protein
MSHVNNKSATSAQQIFHWGDLLEDIVWPTAWVVEIRIKSLMITLCICTYDGFPIALCCLNFFHLGNFLEEVLINLFNTMSLNGYFTETFCNGLTFFVLG